MQDLMATEELTDLYSRRMSQPLVQIHTPFTQFVHWHCP